MKQSLNYIEGKVLGFLKNKPHNTHCDNILAELITSKITGLKQGKEILKSLESKGYLFLILINEGQLCPWFYRLKD